MHAISRKDRTDKHGAMSLTPEPAKEAMAKNGKTISAGRKMKKHDCSPMMLKGHTKTLKA